MVGAELGVGMREVGVREEEEEEGIVEGVIVSGWVVSLHRRVDGRMDGGMDDVGYGCGVLVWFCI